MTGPVSELCGYTSLPEPELLFNDDGRHKHPLIGLIQNGPYSLQFGAPSRLRLALLAPRNELNKLVDVNTELLKVKWYPKTGQVVKL